MKTTHTPGPWKYEADKGYVLKCFIMTADFDEDTNSGSVIARTSDNISEADAALIAAAPDLLAACEALHAEVLAYLTAQNLHGEHNPAMVAARAAIAKAKGEA
jgi:hypothetical protein